MLLRWCSGKEYAYQCRNLWRWEFEPWVGKMPWSRNWQPIQYFCLKNSMDRCAWQRVARSWTWLSDWACAQTGYQCQGIGICSNGHFCRERLLIPKYYVTFQNLLYLLPETLLFEEKLYTSSSHIPYFGPKYLMWII